MIVLDTNVLSDLIRAQPDSKVAAWLSRQARSKLFTTAISRGEKMFGVLVLLIGERRRRLRQDVQAVFDTEMAERVLPYDGDAADAAEAAEAHAAFAAARYGQGRPVAVADAMIAGTAHSRGATLATRNVRDFEGCGIPSVDPRH